METHGAQPVGFGLDHHSHSQKQPLLHLHHGAGHIARRIVAGGADRGQPSRVVHFIEQREEFDPVDGALAERGFLSASGEIADAVAELHVGDLALERAQSVGRGLAGLCALGGVEVDAEICVLEVGHLSGTTRLLAVLDRGAKSADEYRLTPVELYEFGKRYVAKRSWQAADEHLTPLFESWRLQDNIYQEVVRMLFQTSLELGRDDRMVQYFEIIKEKYPDVEIDFDDILRVAAAYHELGEYERSYLVFRATIESAFERVMRALR